MKTKLKQTYNPFFVTPLYRKKKKKKLNHNGRQIVRRLCFFFTLFSKENQFDVIKIIKICDLLIKYCI